MAAPGHSSAAEQIPKAIGHAGAAEAAGVLARLQEQAHSLASAVLAPRQRLAGLDALRGVAIEATRAQRALYFARPLPLAAPELRAWDGAVSLWQTFHVGYAACVAAHVEPTAAEIMAQRALDSLARALQEHVGAYRAIPATLWKDLHTAWRIAADSGHADTPVHDPHAPQAQTSCRHAYLGAVLHHCANPYLLSGMQARLLEQWLPQWLGLVALSATVPVWASRSPLALDLGSDAGARLARDIGSAKDVRYLDTSALGMRLRELADCARNGKPAPELQAAADVPRPVVERLLTHLYIHWCSAGAAAAEELADEPVRSQVGLGMHAVHFQISGRAFRQPEARYTREEEHDLATFGYITERTEQRLLTTRSAALEPWELTGRTASALALRRGPDLPARIAHGQLVSVRTSSFDPPSLGTVQRLRVEPDGQTHVGVRLIRGEVRGVALRTAGNMLEKFERALLIEGDPQRGTPASLVVAAGRFGPGTRIELGTTRSGALILGASIERGPDFDRLAIEPS